MYYIRDNHYKRSNAKMALSDSMFLFEIVIEDLKSFIDCSDFYIKSQFTNLFNIKLKEPNNLDSTLPKQRKKQSKRKTKVRNIKIVPLKTSTEPIVQSGKSILLATDLDTLINNMKLYPMELSVWTRDYPGYKLGSTFISWSMAFTDYLNEIYRKLEPPPVSVTEAYNIFNDYTSKCMAVIKLNIKLSHFKDKITTQFTSLVEESRNTFMHTEFNFKPTTMLKYASKSINWEQNTGVIKTIYAGNKQKSRKNSLEKRESNDETVKKETSNSEDYLEETKHQLISNNLNNSRKSDADIEINKQIDTAKSTQSCSSFSQDQINILDYIFNDGGPVGDQVYCVNYFTVDNDLSIGTNSGSPTKLSTDKSEPPTDHYRFKVCSDDCKNVESGSICSLDLPEEATHLITVDKCKYVTCDNKKHRPTPPVPDDKILLDLSSLKRECCDITEKVEEVVGGVKAKMKMGDDPCFCECECKFGFVKRTTYCKICGGYEDNGEDLADPKTGQQAPFPCPIYHNLVDKKKMESGSDTKRKDGSKPRSVADKSESERDSKKGKKKKENRFKFNYGYTAPKIGHSQCAFPCTGTLGAVPKNMGWLWTADNVPGLKFRPMWKPGATNKHVVRLLRMARNPGIVISKKKKKDTTQKKPLKRPLLVVHKKDGEFTVTMEPVKPYSKPRAPNQYPYEDKPVLTYTIGRTDEENQERQKKKDRARRRLERSQREFIQNAFRDMCQEICLKTYQQALGILPDAEKPTCPCYPAQPGPEHVDLDHSCSCSEDKSLSSSDTDSDEWFVEFTPPNVTFDPTYKSKKVITSDNASQYTYLDYRVKLLDKYGNPVPRFFKGPDGKQQCSDLGGFWGPNHKWLEINVDGYIAPDLRWAPNTFIGPNGESVDTETGKFQAANGTWLYVGIDGYVDCQGKWKAYPRPVGGDKKQRKYGSDKRAGGKKSEKPILIKQSATATFSCFGYASPIALSKMGIVGHGPDKRLLLKKLQTMLAQGADVKLPVPSTVPRQPLTKNIKGRGHSPNVYESRTYFEEITKCRHPTPSEKGVIATDAHGRKTYFKLKEHKNKRPAHRLATLTSQGISLSSFHAPCFHSFISTEIMKKQQNDRIRALYSPVEDRKQISTQTG